MIDFGDLYKYNTANGVIIPDTADVKQKIEFALKQIFNSDDFSTDPNTANGRLIEALTLLFIDICGINAQNINALNIESAFGVFLDNLGSNWGVYRFPDEQDNVYRQRILNSFSRGSGFVASIKNALSAVQNVSSVVVLENGSLNPAMRPLSNSGDILPHSISLQPNSVALFIVGGEPLDIANAVVSTKPCGCGYTTSIDYGTPIKVSYSETSGDIIKTTEDVYFYRPTNRYAKITIKVNTDSFFGIDPIENTKTIVLSVLDNYKTNTVITKELLSSNIARLTSGIIATEITFKISDTDTTVSSGSTVEEIVLPPYKILSINEDTNIIIENE